eukprot:4660737-Amphidinium_carterae.1
MCTTFNPLKRLGTKDGQSATESTSVARAGTREVAELFSSVGGPGTSAAAQFLARAQCLASTVSCVQDQPP